MRLWVRKGHRGDQRKPHSARWWFVRRAVKAVLVVMLLIAVSVGYRRGRQRYYDTFPSPFTLTPEEIATLTDSNQNARIDPCEAILLEGVKARIAEAARSRKRLFIDVGHIAPSAWFRFRNLDELLCYCKRDHDPPWLYVKKRFGHIPKPVFCRGGWGAYLELNADLDFEALWIYEGRKAGLVRWLWPYAFYDETPGWIRYPSALLLRKLGAGPEPVKFIRHDPASMEFALTILELQHKGYWGDRKGLRRFADGVYAAVFNSDLYALIETTREETRKSSPILASLTAAIHYSIGMHPDESTTPGMEVESLFRAGYYYAGEGPKVAAVQSLGRLIENFPDSRYRASAIFYQADAYRSLGWEALGVNRITAARYYRLALERYDELIEQAKAGNDALLLGENLNMSGGSWLEDEMLGQSAAKWAGKMKGELLQDMKGLAAAERKGGAPPVMNDQSLGLFYTVTISNVADRAGNSIDPAGNTAIWNGVPVEVSRFELD